MSKLPLRLPICPSCGARFLYLQVRQNRKEKIVVCPHCKKKLRVSYKKNTALLILFAVLILIGVNYLILAITPYINFIGLFIVTFVGVIITYFLIPFTVRYQ